MNPQLQRKGGLWRAAFAAMGGPCEILFDLDDGAQARWLADLAAEETLRIESKYSRYRADNVIHRLNTAAGTPVTVDPETADLLDFAARCHRLSAGLFDVTTGILRRLWTFDGGDRVPTRKAVKALLPLVGWEKIGWENPVVTVPPGMEIDLGGIGKEYAVDRVAALLAERCGQGILVSFGGDLRVVGKRPDERPWDVGVELPGRSAVAALSLQLTRGALATSGDTHRFLLKDGVRYPHILNPRTGWPVLHAPRSVTVLGDCCTEAGLLCTLAMLHGDRAETFLEAQGIRNWVIR